MANYTTFCSQKAYNKKGEEITVAYMTGYLRQQYGSDDLYKKRVVTVKGQPLNVVSLTISCIISDKFVENYLGKEFVNEQYHSQMVEVELWNHAADRITGENVRLRKDMPIGFFGNLSVIEFDSRNGNHVKRLKMTASDFDLRYVKKEDSGSTGSAGSRPAGTVNGKTSSGKREEIGGNSYESAFSDLPLDVPMA